ncbi:MAG: sigma-70 family RNA polymerase sigma factor [Gemmatimonadaceae bacterium]|nr:sigma-70 family RNA polymerase sigma factor [Gemmatimonadaceae bacterium]
MVERLFREESGRLIALLTRLLGPAHLALAEDVTQEAFIAALGSWPRRGVPDNPSAWLLQVARRRALDVLRRDESFAARATTIAAEFETAADTLDAHDALTAHAESARADDDPFADDRLRMILLCCHPVVSDDSRVALTLKTVSGFSVGEIARAFLAEETAIAQRLVRAKRALRDANVTFAMPEGADLDARRRSVLDVLYVMFNEAHTAHEGVDLVRLELAAEALRLVERLLRHEQTRAPEVSALAAMFCFHAARFPARTSADGALRRLAEQDRTQWDQALIARGFHHLDAAARGATLSTYHCEAQIASLHAIAPSWEATDWERIVAVYDRLLALHPSSVVALNRVVAVRMLRGADGAWREFTRIDKKDPIVRTYLYHAVRADLLEARGRPDEAQAAWETARELARSTPLQLHMEQRVTELAAARFSCDVDSATVRPS